MASVTSLVDTYIESDPVVQKDLARGLINTSALAKFIIKKNKLKASPEAVVTAIRRNVDSNDYGRKFDARRKFYDDSRVTSKNKMAIIALHKRADTLELLGEIFKNLDIYGGDTVRIVKSQDSIEILIDENNLEKVMSIFSPDKVMETQTGIGVVSIKLKKHDIHEIIRTPGVYASVLNELAINNIPIVEAITCLYEVMIFVEEKHLLNAYGVLSKLCGK